MKACELLMYVNHLYFIMKIEKESNMVQVTLKKRRR